jgi:hypothetical protein
LRRIVVDRHVAVADIDGVRRVGDVRNVDDVLVLVLTILVDVFDRRIAIEVPREIDICVGNAVIYLSVGDSKVPGLIVLVAKDLPLVEQERMTPVAGGKRRPGIGVSKLGPTGIEVETISRKPVALTHWLAFKRINGRHLSALAIPTIDITGRKWACIDITNSRVCGNDQNVVDVRVFVDVVHVILASLRKDDIQGTTCTGAPVVAGTAQFAAFEGNDGPLTDLSVDIIDDLGRVFRQELEVWNEVARRAMAGRNGCGPADNLPIRILTHEVAIRHGGKVAGAFIPRPGLHERLVIAGRAVRVVGVTIVKKLCLNGLSGPPLRTNGFCGACRKQECECG